MVLSILLMAALILITIDYHGGDNSPLRGLRGIGAAIFGPVEHVAAVVVHPIGTFAQAVTDAPSERNRADRLLRDNQRLRQQLNAQRLDRSRLAQLDRLLGTAGLGGYRIVAAQVISAGQGFEDTVTIDVGSKSGIKGDMTVLTADGLVGRVTRVGPTTATVLLATDAASTVGARLEQSQQIGVVQGTGRRGLGGGTATPMRLQLLDANAMLVPGQRLLTLGSQNDRPFVPGVPIGTVVSVRQTPGSLTRTALVRPFVNYTSLDVVGVVVAPPRTDPHDAVLPPAPSTTPTH